MKPIRHKGLRRKAAAVALSLALVANVFGFGDMGTSVHAAGLNDSKELDLKFESNIVDSSVNGIEGILIGDATYIEGKVGQALQFNGINNYIDLGTSAALQPESLTVSFWVKPDEALIGEHIVVWNKPSGAWDGEGWYLSILDNNTPLKLSTGTGVQESYVTGDRNEFFPVGEWTHVAVTYDHATRDAAIYRNGVAQEVSYSIQDGGIVANDVDHKYLGFNSPGYGGGYAKMALDEFKIYSQAASAAEIADIFQAENSADDSKQLELKFDGDIMDSSANGIQGTMNGAAVYVEGKVGQALKLNGSNNYIDLGTSAVLQPQDLTVSFWVKPDEVLVGEHMIMWNKPSGAWNGEGWYLSILNDNTPLKLSTGTGVQESYVTGNRSQFFPVGEWTHVAVTYDHATRDVAIYRNGMEQQVSYTTKRGGIVANDTDHKYLGFNSPGYGGGYAKVALDEFKIYSDAFTAAKVRNVFQAEGGLIDEASIAQLDLDSIMLPSSIRASLPLPLIGKNGSSIAWHSSNTDVLSHTGEVNVPEVDTPLTLSVSVTYGSVILNKDYAIVVRASAYSGDFAPIQPFDLEEVKVTHPFYVNAFNKNLDYLLKLDPDRLMSGFREVAGLPKKAELYGGWEGGWSYLRGHTMGHYLTALAQAYKQTKGNPTVNQQVKAKIDYLVDELKAVQDANDNGYIFATPEAHFDVIEGKVEGPSWVPWYTMHKIVVGLVDVYRYADNELALDLASKLGDWTYNRTQTWDEATHTRVLKVEYGGMNDGLYELYKITQNPTHLIAAHMFDEDSLFTPIVNGNDVLQNSHANTQIVKFIGALNRYRTVGEEAEFYLKAAENFFEMVVHDHTYVTGGNSENEHFRAPGHLDAHRNNVNAETCNAYNMLKLARELFRLTGDIKYADYYERAFLNEVMASMNPETGMTTYFKPMGVGYFKLYGTEFDSFWCDTGTGMESFSKLGDSIYFRSESELYVNMYISSTLQWTAKGFQLTQQADLPASDKAIFTISEASAESLTLKFRSPDWVPEGQSVGVIVNGQSLPTNAVDGYINVERIWTAGDVVELTFPMEIKASTLQDNEEAVAFMYGPIVLSAAMGTEEMVGIPHLASGKAGKPAGVTYKEYILIENGNVGEWIANLKDNLVKTEGKVEFTLRNTDEDDNLVFTPFYLNTGERYGIYFYLSALDSPFFQNNILNRKDSGRRTSALIDEVQITNDQHELVHNLQGNSSGGSYGGYQYRHAFGENTGAAWLSYDMTVNSEITNYIVVKYYSGDQGRTFNVYVDETLIREETVEARTPAQFYDVRYEIPANLVAGKSKVTVKFANRGRSHVGGLFGTVAILKDYSNNASLQDVTAGGTAASLKGSVYEVAVPRDAVETMVRFTPANANALVYVGDILIDDTVDRRIDLDAATTTLDIRVVAEDRETEQTYTLLINKQTEEQVTATGVSLSSTSLGLTVGGTGTLSATVAPANATNKSVSWTSSNTNVATVDATGKVTAVAVGTATITVTTVDGGHTATATITISAGGGGPQPTPPSSSTPAPTATPAPTETPAPTVTPKPTEKPVPPRFVDLKGYSWAEEAINALAKQGIVNGTSESSFTPGRNITRADFITLLVRALGLTAEVSGNFRDVAQDAYYYEAVAIAKQLGITTGIGDNSFNPRGEISRQDMMVLVTRALQVAGKGQLTGSSSDLSGFTDTSDIAGYAAEAVAALVKDGIIVGNDKGRINPRGSATRAETAVILYRILNKYNQE